jgi:hypothetical protein
VAGSFIAGEPLAARNEATNNAAGEHALPAGEAIVSTEASASEATGRPGRAASVRAALAAHPGEIFVLPSGRRIPVENLLDHLEDDGSAGDWVEEPCEVRFARKIEPWAAPSSAPCWERMSGPLWHLWSLGSAAEPPKLIGLVIPDQRAADRAVEVEPLLAEDQLELREEAIEESPAAPAEEPVGQIELSDLIVECEYHPRLKETDPAILALTPPAGEGWQPRWWKLGSRPLWQYGWYR